MRIFYSNGRERIIPKTTELTIIIISLVLFLLLLNENLVVKNESKKHNAATKSASILEKSSAGYKTEPSYPIRQLIIKKFDMKYKILQDKRAIDL